ncbi:MAG TPA: undecaprenyl-diphosphate phosphatase, partial [Opitutaceae bacterium]
GLLFDDLIDAHLFSVETVAVALLVGAVIMTAADRWQRRRAKILGESLPDPSPADMSARQALLIGLLQCLAMWPGMSRSMMTIVGGYLAGLRPARAAEFSFLLGLPTLAGAALYKSLGAGGLVVSAFGWQPLLIGCVVAAVSAALSVRWLVAYLTRHGLALFAGYRVILAAVVLLILG